MNKLKVAIVTLLPIILLHAETTIEWGGSRSSIYGAVPFPENSAWTYINRNIKTKTGASIPAAIWIVGHLDSRDGSCFLEFEQPKDLASVPEKVKFLGDSPDWTNAVNDHEATLDFFDANGIKVFLQVEPGMADLSILMDIVMKQYKHHPSVIGFGYDIEWFHVPDDQHVNGGGNGFSNKVDKTLATKWNTQLKSFNPNYTLFLKHWIKEYLAKTPQDVVKDVLYINDSQGFTWGDDPLALMSEEFADWASYFDPSPAGFQYGYEQDVEWWPNLENPIGDIAKSIKEAIDYNGSDQKLGMFWVDFTLQHAAVKDLWEKTGATLPISTVGVKTPAKISISGRKIQFGEPMKSVLIYSPSGKLIQEMNGLVRTVEINPRNSTAIYLIKSISQNGTVTSSYAVIR